MKIYKQDIKNNKKDVFIQRARVMLASRGLVPSNKTLEVLYWVMYYTFDHPFNSKDQEFKNMNQMHVLIAKQMEVAPPYIGSYLNKRLIDKKILSRTMSVPTDRFSRAKIEKYDIPLWLETLYTSDKFKIDLTYSYE
jgi:hypothetical protein